MMCLKPERWPPARIIDWDVRVCVTQCQCSSFSVCPTRLHRSVNVLDTIHRSCVMARIYTPWNVFSSFHFSRNVFSLPVAVIILNKHRSYFYTHTCSFGKYTQHVAFFEPTRSCTQHARWCVGEAGCYFEDSNLHLTIEAIAAVIIIFNSFDYN